MNQLETLGLVCLIAISIIYFGIISEPQKSTKKKIKKLTL